MSPSRSRRSRSGRSGTPLSACVSWFAEIRRSWRLRQRGAYSRRRLDPAYVFAESALADQIGQPSGTGFGSRPCDLALHALVRLLERAPHETDVLTAREAQVAAQVAEEKSNREVAAALYLTPKAVEFHLTRIYRKLGVRSRSELVRLMSERPASSPPPDVGIACSRASSRRSAGNGRAWSRTAIDGACVPAAPTATDESGG